MVSSSFFRLTSDALLTRWRPQVSQNLVQSVGKSFWRTIRKFYLQKGNKSNQLNRSKVLEVLPEVCITLLKLVNITARLCLDCEEPTSRPAEAVVYVVECLAISDIKVSSNFG